ncbi:TATA box-binding protein-associated factor RNA polymerase I subunit A [Xyrauchen texanus]|uniref:TATA box-binding protein-associated factor RNA polymerase I subunit A n=1 Tax=Xyrauchen texanus TaxID=154827 RepID=UPI0022429638|nr:TATA box-binding protein-associated factor RNA polymerase I subunit A [Xyrauchen texanus]XP_051951447.1 TATA box-binding protein-associated factor RNA polymerase I subunit A [Xyrauchen texanus]
MDDFEAELNIPAADLESPEEEAPNQGLIKEPIHLHIPPKYKGRSRETGFHKSTRNCLKMIRDAMLHHRWQEAAEYFSSYTQTLEDTTVSRQTMACEIIWRLGTEILHHLPNATAVDFNALYNQTKNSGVRNYAKICLEHVFHLLLNGQFDEAKRELSIAESWRYGKQSAAQPLETKFIRAYCGFLDYLIWCDKRPTGSEAEDVSDNHEMHSYFRQASVTLREIIRQPGIWDPFVLSYISMLEFYHKEDEALKVLQNYAYNTDFPSNPNAHIYLYQFLKRHKAPQSKLISSLRILHSLVPSHELMLELCDLLVQTRSERNLEEALRVSMDLLEFSSWKFETKAWQCLLDIMMNTKDKYWLQFIKKEWSIRRSLWLVLHFRAYIGRKDSVQNVKLLKIKTQVLRRMGEGNITYFGISLKVRRREQADKAQQIDDG